MFGRGFRLFVGVSGASVALPLIAFLMVITFSHLTTAPHLLEEAVRATLTSVMMPYLLLGLVAAVSLALVDVLKPTFCITASVSVMLMMGLLISAYNRRDHLDAAACSVSCARHVTNVSNIPSLRRAAEGAYCWFIPGGTKAHRSSRCYVHDPSLIVAFPNGHYLELLGMTYGIMLMLGVLVAFSSPSPGKRLESCVL